jgi:hypothetical protein
MSNFREKLDELNDQVAEFDNLQGKTESLEAELDDTKTARDKALDAVHDIIHELNDMLPARPEEAPPQTSPSPFQARNW